MRNLIGKLSKIKHRKVICIAGVLIVAGIGISIFFVLNARGQNVNEIAATIQESTATVGTVGTSIVGTGSLTTADSSNIQVTKGLVIDEVTVETGDEVKQGDVIATVTQGSVASVLLDVKDSIESVQDDIDDLSSDADDSSTSEYLKKLVLESELADLKDTETDLTELLNSLSITAESDGVISSLSIEDGSIVGSTSSSSDSSNSDSMTGVSAIQQTNTFSFLSDVDTESESAPTSTDTAAEITECKELNIAAPVTGAMPQSNVAIKSGTTANYTGTISWNTSEKLFKADTEYTATIVLTADAGYTFSDGILVEVDHAYLVEWAIFGSGEGNRLRIVAKYAKTAASMDSASDTGSSDKQAASGSSASGSASSGSMATGSTSSGSVASGSVSSGTASSTSTDSSSSSTADTGELQSTIGTISSASQVQVSINVDELDILSVAEGQTATITMDALENQEFEGTVSRVSREASSSDNSTKYVVEILLDRIQDMFLGMTASATINISQVENAVLIPVSAIQESSGRVFVYTEKDNDGNLSGEVEIETGISDGSQVEVTSGLSEGDTVYYLRSESTESSETMIFGGQMPEGMEMPSGGNMSMPSGGGRMTD